MILGTDTFVSVSANIPHMFLAITNEHEAKKIVASFLQQHYSGITIENAVLKDKVWTVEVLVSTPVSKKFKVEINSTSGRIIAW